MNAGHGGNHFSQACVERCQGFGVRACQTTYGSCGTLQEKFWFFSSISHKHLTILATHMGLYASWSGSFSPLHIDQLKEEEFVDQLRWMINRFALPHLQELHGFFWAAPRWSVCRVRVARNSFHPAISRCRGFEMVELAY